VVLQVSCPVRRCHQTVWVSQRAHGHGEQARVRGWLRTTHGEFVGIGIIGSDKGQRERAIVAPYPLPYPQRVFRFSRSLEMF
jgi:hypothetical protein